MPFDPHLLIWRRNLMTQEPTRLTEEERQFLESINAGVCERGGWQPHHFACQTDHFHLLLSSETDSKQIRRWVKTWFTQALNEKFGKKNGLQITVVRNGLRMKVITMLCSDTSSGSVRRSNSHERK